MANTFLIGTTLYSFQMEYLTCRWSFEDCMELAAHTGGDRGVEIVGVMHHRCWPNLSREFERVFKSSVARWQLIPTHYGAYADMTVHPDLEDRFQFHVTQLQTAKRLGFPLVRIQSPGVDPIVERLTRVAEKMKLRMAIEVHTPLMFENPDCQALIEMVRKVSSESLGLLPDCSIFEDMEAVRRAQGTVAEPGQQPAFPPSNPAKLAGIMPFIMGVHGKFHRVVNGEIPEVPYAAIAKVLVNGGFRGWMSTEFEGGELGDYQNSFEVVKAHHALMKRLLAQSA